MKKFLPVLAGMALLVTACAYSDQSAGIVGGGATPPPPAGGPSSAGRTLTVFAAASLTESFDALKPQFLAAHPGVTVTFDFEGSSALVAKLANGAKADVLASADQANMDKATQAGVIDGRPAVFATNRLVIVTAPGNPKGVRSFADLAGSGMTLVVCAPQVPCGAAAQKVERNTGVTLTPASEEQDVKQVLAKVESGDADAGLVYVTDAASAGGKVQEVDFPEAASAVNSYPIAVVKGSAEAELARAFDDFVLGTAGQTALQRDGFGKP